MNVFLTTNLLVLGKHTNYCFFLLRILFAHRWFHKYSATKKPIYKLGFLEYFFFLLLLILMLLLLLLFCDKYNAINSTNSNK